MAEPKVALVLGGGGIKPYSAVPLLKFLESNNIKLNLIAGCSGGSIMTALFASGYSPDDIVRTVVPGLKKDLFKPNLKAFASIARLPYCKMDKESALIKPDALRKKFREYFGNMRIEDLGMKIVLQATDFQTGEGVGIETGDLADGVYASSAIYPMLPAIRIGERWLFDGVFSAPVPVLQAVRHRPDIIIAVDFLEKLSPDPRGYLETSIHTGKIYARTIAAAQTCLTLNLQDGEVIYIKMVFDKYISIWDIDKMPAILKAGEIALEKVKDEILSAYRHHQQINK